MMLGADGRLSDDTAMRHIAAIPRLRRLRAQEAVATDDGFEALEPIADARGVLGTRVCPNFGSRAFVALLDDAGAAADSGSAARTWTTTRSRRFRDFPSLRELTPIGVQDAGFRHIGRCERLERLTCMYCRDTTDAATAHIAGLPAELLLRRPDADHRSQPGDSRAACRRSSRSSSTSARASPMPACRFSQRCRGCARSRWKDAGRHAGRNEGVSVAGAGKVFDVTRRSGAMASRDLLISCYTPEF